MTDQPQQGKNEPGTGETPEGYQPTLRLPDYRQDASQQPAPPTPPAGQDAGQDAGHPATEHPATEQFAQSESEPPQQPYQGGHPGEPQPDRGQFSSPYPPVYGDSGRPPYGSGDAAYGQPYVQPSPYAQPGSPNAYGQPAYYGAPAAPKALSIASMCCGIAALVGFGFFLLPQLAAVILGHLALRREPAGRGMAIAGLVMGYVGIAITVLVLIVFGMVLGSVRNSG
ncbi:DUF4190 domain-containing protein [Arthrobacter oryzae]|uniref:Uncharacterized protein DUF4190 n=1 Tax=Arthrobacter oryzae TaxID=409290 RepID=A0A495ESJ8_9MICC|nr:DUF4190 domain-containing protein [Arthrobacter oryzae]RKR19975.1 uncharacterized protein DUF4190 [Arthrobacter oryzae]